MMPVEFFPTDFLYPELLDFEIIVSYINSPEDVRKNFLFCLDINLNGLLTYSIRRAWPFKTLLLPLNQKKGVKGILLIKQKKSRKDFLLESENVIRKLSFKKILIADYNASCKEPSVDESRDLIEEISYRTGKKIIYLSGGENG